MTLLTEPTRIVLAKGYSLPDDADAVAYIAAVEAADGQALETATRMAINSFVKGCKADGIWDAIKASCIMAGARTLAGALIPLKGTAPTNYNFVTGDYNRKTGLVGDGSTKYLNSNRNNNADPQNSLHLGVYITGANSINPASYAGSGGTGPVGRLLQSGSGSLNSKCGDVAVSYVITPAQGNTLFFKGVSRSQSSTRVVRSGGVTSANSLNSDILASSDIAIFARDSLPNQLTNARLSFYSIGESLDLALLDARVTTLINNINDALTWGWAMTITIADTTHTLRLNAACTFVVDWGDGTQETLTSTTNWTYTKTYAAPGTYRLRFSIQSGTFYPYYSNVTADAAELRTLEGTGPEAWSFGSSLINAFYGASGLTEVSGGMNTAGVIEFGRTWRNCTSLTSFPLLDVSSGSRFQDTWQNCSSLTSFPLLDVSSGVKFNAAWHSCISLTSFPPLDVSSGTAFTYAWIQCSSLTSFPRLDVSSGTEFFAAWASCSSLTSFPANFFDVTGTLIPTAFTNAFANCALTAASIENILTSLVTNGQSNITLTLSGGTNAGAATWTPAAIAAYGTLTNDRGWTISRNA